MIAELDDKPFSFSTFNLKVSYHESKIERGVGEFMYSSLGAKSIKEFESDSQMIARMNEKVKSQFQEVSISLVKGERLSDEKYLELAHDYMMRLGYADSSYAVIKHTDKKDPHIHILFTTIDQFGEWITDSNIKRRSQTISRKLEQEYNLIPTEYSKFNDKSLGEIKAREFYFHKALSKGLKSYTTKVPLMEILGQELLKEIENLKAPLNNTGYELLLGTELYDRVGGVLEKNSYFKPLYKDELLKKMDEAYAKAKSFPEFKEILENNNCYLRFITKNGTSSYVYGLPDVPIYYSDKSLPKKYRYGELTFSERGDMLTADEQKHIIYNQAFLALNTTNNFSEFKAKLKKENIELIESINKSGIYGLSFAISNIKNSITFKASEVSKRLSFAKINSYFDEKVNQNSGQSIKNSISTVVGNPLILSEMKSDLQDNYPDFIDTNYRREVEDITDLSRKKNKKRNRDENKKR